MELLLEFVAGSAALAKLHLCLFETLETVAGLFGALAVRGLELSDLVPDVSETIGDIDEHFIAHTVVALLREMMLTPGECGFGEVLGLSSRSFMIDVESFDGLAEEVELAGWTRSEGRRRRYRVGGGEEPSRCRSWNRCLRWCWSSRCRRSCWRMRRRGVPEAAGPQPRRAHEPLRRTTPY